MSPKFKPNQTPFPVVFLLGRPDGRAKTQVGLLHVARLAEIPVVGDQITLPRKDQERHWRSVLNRSIHYKAAEANEPAVIDFVEVFLA
jgi:hypothetical protein